MIRVQRQDFDVGAEVARLGRGNSAVGAVCAFVGLVRDYDGTLGAMTLEHYPGMTERALEKIEAEAQARWPLEDSLIIHRHGRLEPGDNIVLVVTVSPHRKAAFESCEFLIDWLKTKAPFWKREEGPGGARWVEARATDDEAATRWNGDGKADSSR